MITTDIYWISYLISIVLYSNSRFFFFLSKLRKLSFTTNWSQDKYDSIFNIEGKSNKICIQLSQKFSMEIFVRIEKDEDRLKDTKDRKIQKSECDMM